MAKTYRIRVQLDTSGMGLAGAEAALTRVEARSKAMGDAQEKAALKGRLAVEKATAAEATARENATEKALKQEALRGAAREKGAAKALADEARNVASLERMQEQYFMREMARRNQYEAQKIQTEERAALKGAAAVVKATAAEEKARQSATEKALKLEALRGAAREKGAAKALADEARNVASLGLMEEKAFMRDSGRRNQYEAQKQRAVERAALGAVAAAEREAVQRDKIADRWIAREHARDLAAARQKEQAAAASAKRLADLTDRVALGGLAMAAAVGLKLQGIYHDIEVSAENAAKAVIEARKNLRVEADVVGAPRTTNAVLLSAAKFRVETGLERDTGSDFSRQYAGSLPIGLEKFEQSGGKAGISPKVADELKIEAGIMAARKGGNAGTRGELAGLLGQFGPVPSAEAGVGQLEAIRAALTKGRGDDSPLTQQLLNVAGTLVREGGPLAGLPELGAVIGITSLSGGEQKAGERALQLHRALFADTVKQTKAKGAQESSSAYATRLGIKESMDMEARADIILQDVRKARLAGRDVDKYLIEHGFRNDESRRAMIETEPNLESMKSRMAESRVAGQGKAVMDANKAYKASPEGRVAIGEAMKSAAELSQGIRGEPLLANKTAADASPEVRRGDENVSTYVGDVVRGLMAGSIGSARTTGRDTRVTNAAMDALNARAAKAGVDATAMRSARLAMLRGEGSPDPYARYTSQVESLITARGGSLAADPTAVIADLTATMKEANRLARQDMAGNASPGPVNPAVPVPLRPRPAPPGDAGRP